WALFAHSAWGVHRYASADGIVWRDRGIVLRNAMRPFARRIEADTAGAAAGVAHIAGAPRADSLSAAARPAAAPYHLYAEAYAPLALPLTALPGRRRWRSEIVLSRSADLALWSPTETVARPDLPWMRDAELGASVSNPCLVRAPGSAGGWRLYYSASLAWIPDCGFCEPRHLAAAESLSPSGPFEPHLRPISDPADDPLPGVLGAGSIKVLHFDDGWAGLQNKIYRDPAGRSRSAIFLLRSEDGLAWRPARDEPLLAPAGFGWTRSHVYACDCRFREADGLWYLYFNARDGWRISEGKERIGRIVGRA
ncbi:hypothetical protein LWX53_10760, partial [bacterium]|nr:hypothetical protein [bacterium]